MIVKMVRLEFHDAFAPYVTGDDSETELGRGIAAGLYLEADVPAERVVFLRPTETGETE